MSASGVVGRNLGQDFGIIERCLVGNFVAYLVSSSTGENGGLIEGTGFSIADQVGYIEGFLVEDAFPCFVEHVDWQLVSIMVGGSVSYWTFQLYKNTILKAKTSL